jgi:hypothetical protein
VFSLNWILIKVLFQNFFYFWALNIAVGVEGVPIFQQSVDAELYEWLLAEQKRRKAAASKKKLATAAR